MAHSEPTPNARLDALRARFNARAAGWWRVAADRGQLEQVAFCSDDRMSAEVFDGFAAATRVVPLRATDLGIVRAAITGRVAVSRLSESSAESGSGLWMRKFEATHSVAVPVFDENAAVVRVVSLALGDDGGDDATVSQAILDAATSWFDATTGPTEPMPRQ